MAKPNYSFEKRQRELAKAKKKAEKEAEKAAELIQQLKDGHFAILNDLFEDKK